MARTEEQKLVQAGIKVILGGREYEIRPLVIRESREWRRKAVPFQSALVKYASVNSDNPEELGKALNELLIDRIDQAIDLFFDYAKDLNRGEIEDLATDREIVEALNEVNAVAFPFGESKPKPKIMVKP